ncbi:uncharacterized protein VP01_2962g3 [Puccinia sorghi]|uniref:Uncharacterized protein n=1 Tax=Puccinia sorghi TaxID=27349 RepID=A0A0L6V0R8_9BASI|nr:uncharacterized protein VP01_2962g3 [Puccinia sorghi]
MFEPAGTPHTACSVAQYNSNWSAKLTAAQEATPPNTHLMNLNGKKSHKLRNSLPPSMMLQKSSDAQIRSQYDAAQLIPAANEMISKLKKSLIKLKHLEKNLHFLAEQHTTLTTDDALRLFKFDARVLKKKKNKKKDKLLTIIEADIFGEATIAQDLGVEIDQYIAEVNEKASTNIITYWSQHKKNPSNKCPIRACNTWFALRIDSRNPKGCWKSCWYPFPGLILLVAMMILMKMGLSFPHPSTIHICCTRYNIDYTHRHHDLRKLIQHFLDTFQPQTTKITLFNSHLPHPANEASSHSYLDYKLALLLQHDLHPSYSLVEHDDHELDYCNLACISLERAQKDTSP